MATETKKQTTSSLCLFQYYGSNNKDFLLEIEN